MVSGRPQGLLANEQVVDGEVAGCGRDSGGPRLEQWFSRSHEYADELITDLSTHSTGLARKGTSLMQQGTGSADRRGARLKFHRRWRCRT